MTPEQIPTAVDTAIALGAVAAFVSLAALRLGYARALIEWLGYGRKNVETIRAAQTIPYEDPDIARDEYLEREEEAREAEMDRQMGRDW